MQCRSITRSTAVRLHSLYCSARPPTLPYGSMSEIQPKDVVQELMTFVREEERDVVQNGVVSRINVPHLIYECPRKDLCRNTLAEVVFQKGRGFTNPFDHLVSCYKPKEQLFAEVRQRWSQTLTPHVHFTEREQAIFSFIQLIVLKNVPISAVEDNLYRSFCKYDVDLSRQTLKNVMFNLVELVENKITCEMTSTKGSIMHDGWTHAGTHHIGLFAMYAINDEKTGKSQVRTPLLSMSPMAMMCKCPRYECECDAETTSFDSQTHAEHIRSIFSLYSIPISSWLICQVTDNCNVNGLISELLSIPHVGCSSHKLNLEVETMVQADQNLKSCLELVHTTMTDVRGKLRNRAMLRNLTSLCPVVENKTRWSGKCHMLRRFCVIYDHLRAVCEQENATVSMNLTPSFKANVKRLSDQLDEIDSVTKFLQTEHLSLADCRVALDTLIELVAEQKDDPESKLHNCMMGTGHISSNSRHCRNKSFESGVIKIQRNSIRTMTQAEKRACRALLLESEGNIDDMNAAESSVLSEIKKRRKLSHSSPKYMDASFILGSVALVERLWSLARNVLTDNRKNCSPILIEAILFLKVNSAYWDCTTVAAAISKTRSDRVEAQMAADNQVEQEMLVLPDE